MRISFASPAWLSLALLVVHGVCLATTSLSQHYDSDSIQRMLASGSATLAVPTISVRGQCKLEHDRKLIVFCAQVSDGSSFLEAEPTAEERASEGIPPFMKKQGYHTYNKPRASMYRNPSAVVRNGAKADLQIDGASPWKTFTPYDPKTKKFRTLDPKSPLAVAYRADPSKFAVQGGILECPRALCAVGHKCPLADGVCCQTTKTCCPAGTSCLASNPTVCVPDPEDASMRCAEQLCNRGMSCPIAGVGTCCTGGNMCCPLNYKCKNTIPPSCQRIISKEELKLRKLLENERVDKHNHFQQETVDFQKAQASRCCYPLHSLDLAANSDV